MKSCLRLPAVAVGIYENILLPFDGSDGASAVLHHASEIAHRTDATIHLLFVADTARESVTVVETDVVDEVLDLMRG